MKKLLTSVATIALVGGSVSGTTAWTMNHNINQSNPHASNESETAQGIAYKLLAKTIDLDPVFWVGRDIADNVAKLRDAIVQQGLLTRDEVQYVSWGHLTLAKAVVYPNCIFTVRKNGQFALAKRITLDVTGNPAAQIAQKLQGKTINLDLATWYNKKISSNLTLFREDLVKEGLLKQNQAQYVYNGSVKGTLNKPETFKDSTFYVVKNGQVEPATGITLNAVDNQTAEDIANRLRDKTVILDFAFWQGKNPLKYRKEFDNALVNQHLIRPYEVQYVTLLWPFEQITATDTNYGAEMNVNKDGSSAHVGFFRVGVRSGILYIADKLSNATIKLDPDFWVGKLIEKNENRLREAIARQKILTLAQAQHVKLRNSLGYLQEKVYHNVIFSVNNYETGKYLLVKDITIDVTK